MQNFEKSTSRFIQWIADSKSEPTSLGILIQEYGIRNVETSTISKRVMRALKKMENNDCDETATLRLAKVHFILDKDVSCCLKKKMKEYGVAVIKVGKIFSFNSNNGAVKLSKATRQGEPNNMHSGDDAMSLLIQRGETAVGGVNYQDSTFRFLKWIVDMKYVPTSLADLQRQFQDEEIKNVQTANLGKRIRRALAKLETFTDEKTLHELVKIHFILETKVSEDLQKRIENMGQAQIENGEIFSFVANNGAMILRKARRQDGVPCDRVQNGGHPAPPRTQKQPDRAVVGVDVEDDEEEVEKDDEDIEEDIEENDKEVVEDDKKAKERHDVIFGHEEMIWAKDVLLQLHRFITSLSSPTLEKLGSEVKEKLMKRPSRALTVDKLIDSAELFFEILRDGATTETNAKTVLPYNTVIVLLKFFLLNLGVPEDRPFMQTLSQEVSFNTNKMVEGHIVECVLQSIYQAAVGQFNL